MEDYPPFRLLSRWLSDRRDSVWNYLETTLLPSQHATFWSLTIGETTRFTLALTRHLHTSPYLCRSTIQHSEQFIVIRNGVDVAERSLNMIVGSKSEFKNQIRTSFCLLLHVCFVHASSIDVRSVDCSLNLIPLLLIQFLVPELSPCIREAYDDTFCFIYSWSGMFSHIPEEYSPVARYHRNTSSCTRTQCHQCKSERCSLTMNTFSWIYSSNFEIIFHKNFTWSGCNWRKCGK